MFCVLAHLGRMANASSKARLYSLGKWRERLAGRKDECMRRRERKALNRNAKNPRAPVSNQLARRKLRRRLPKASGQNQNQNQNLKPAPPRAESPASPAAPPRDTAPPYPRTAAQRPGRTRLRQRMHERVGVGLRIVGIAQMHAGEIGGETERANRARHDRHTRRQRLQKRDAMPFRARRHREYVRCKHI